MFLNVRRVIFKETERITRYKLINQSIFSRGTGICLAVSLFVQWGGEDENIVVQYEASSPYAYESGQGWLC